MATSPLQQVGVARVVGLALQRWSGVVSAVGNRLMGRFGARETLLRTRRAVTVRSQTPVVEKCKFIAPSAVLAGSVRVGCGSSVWYGSVIRAEHGAVVIGENTHIQERVVLRSGVGSAEAAVTIGSNVTIEAGALIEGPCTVEEGAFLCAGCVLLPGSHVQRDSVVGPGVVVDATVTVAPGTVVLAEAAGVGNATTSRAVTAEERLAYTNKAKAVAAFAAEHEELNTMPVEAVAEAQVVVEKMLELLNDPRRFRATPVYVLQAPKPYSTFAGPTQIPYVSEHETVTHTVK